MEIEKINDIKIPFLQIHQGDFVFYVAAVKVRDLLTICKPLEDFEIESKNYTSEQIVNLQKALEQSSFNKEIDEIISETPSEPYQRILNEARAKKIARYLNEPDSIFPNTIILAINPEFSPEIVSDNGQAYLRIPKGLDTAVILDGQHRIAAFRYVNEPFKEKRLDNFQVIVTFLFDVPFYLQAEIFAIINGTQTKVNRSIVYSLLGYKNQGGDIYKGEMAAFRFSHYITRVLNSSRLSPWQELIKMRGTGAGVVTQAAIIDHLKELLSPKINSSRVNYYPVLYQFYKEQRINELSKYLIIYFQGIKLAWPQYWGNKTSLLTKTNGVAVMFRILHDLVIWKGDLSQLNLHEISEKWKRVPEDKIQNPPSGGSKGYQTQLYNEFISQMLSEQELQSQRNAMKTKLIDIGGLI